MSEMKKRVTIVIIFLIAWLILSVKSFNNIIDYDNDGINIIKSRHPGDGRLYVTEDKELIDMFISMMEQSKYFRFIETNEEVGSATYRLFSDDEEIISIDFSKENRINFDEKHYIIINDIENEKISFYNSFWTEENVK